MKQPAIKGEFLVLYDPKGEEFLCPKMAPWREYLKKGFTTDKPEKKSEAAAPVAKKASK